MIMQIDRQTLRKLAHLARLEFDGESEEAMIRDLNEIIAWVDQLGEVDTTGVEPLTHMSLEVNAFREDEPGNHLNRENALGLAPEKDGEYFRVPRILPG
jgi:aspartyl-tRNA(Asn)/glutamyl-tRNA(Gln) amidotransferase subunit C